MKKLLTLAIWAMLVIPANAQLLRSSPQYTGKGGPLTLPVGQFDEYNVTLTANTLIVFSIPTIPPGTQAFRINTCQDASGGWTPTFSAPTGLSIVNRVGASVATVTANACDTEYWTYRASSNQLVLESVSFNTIGSAPLSALNVTGPVSVTGNSGNGTDQISNVNVNLSMNPYSFGASGSVSTGACTTTIGNSLTGCTGISSFAVGQNIRILNAGNVAASATPAAPTVTPSCGGSGCSTAGSHSYVYSIASLDAKGNAAISPASATTTVNSIGALGAQIVDKAQNVVGTFVFNHVTWSAASGAVGYMVCAQVDGGPNIPWAITTGLSFNDEGLPQLGTRFVPADYGWPATCPSASVRNNVFAKIATIVGSTITITPQTIQPLNIASVAYPSTPQVGISATIEHDDTPAFRAMEVKARAAAAQVPKQIHVPCGDFNLNLSQGENSPNFLVAMDLSSIQNLTILGDGNCSYLHAKGNQSDYTGFGDAIFYSATDGSATPPRYTFNDSAHYPEYSLNDPVSQSVQSVTFSTAAQAANIPVGDDAWITINQAQYPSTRFSEKNKIVSLNATTGVSTLERPTNKAYSATTYLGMCTNNGCAGAPLIADVTAGVTSRHIYIHDLQAEGPVRLAFTGQIEDWKLWNLTVPKVISWGQSVYDTGLQACDHCYLGFDSLLDQEGAPVGSSGDDRVSLTNSTIVSTGGFASQACTEGTAHLRISDNVYFISGQNESNGAVWGMGPGCFSPIIHHNSVSISNGNMAVVAGAQQLIQGGVLDDNSIISDSLASTPAFFRTVDNPTEMVLTNNVSNLLMPRGLDASYLPPDNGPGLMDGYGIQDGGMTFKGGLKVSGITDPSAPTVTGVPVGATSCPNYYVVYHTNLGITNVSSAGVSSTCVATPSATTWNTITAATIPPGVVSIDVLKTNTSTSLGVALPVTGQSDISGQGFIYRDIGQATAGYAAPTANTTTGAQIPLIPLNLFQVGNNGSGSTTQQTAFQVRSDTAAFPTTFKLWNSVAGNSGWDLVANSNAAAENSAGTWDLQFDTGGGNIKMLWTPNGGSVTQPFTEASAGDFTAKRSISTQGASDANPRERSFATQGILIGNGAAPPTVVINEAGVFSPTPFAFAALAATLTVNGQSGFCSDCKNVVSDAVTAGAACVGSGTGAPAVRVNGVYQCN